MTTFLQNANGRLGQNEAAWQPTVYQLPEDLERLQALCESTSPQVVDQIGLQLADLKRIRELSSSNSTEPLPAEDDQNFGCWVYYPWRNAVTHVLPLQEFREVRTNRNKHKISEQEQITLSRKTIGVVGLSVGKASAIAMALEGIGTTFRVADFDHLELSNLNRLVACPTELGLSKARVAARQLYEVDPFLSIELFELGIVEENVDSFLGDADEKIDLLVEGADDLSAKFLLRERARHLAIPVIMETSDRGMLDVERFDLEPKRALLHGLFRADSYERIKSFSKDERLATILRIVEANRGSANAIASLMEIEQTLCTWPQLASDVVLGSSLVAHAARRILLGEPLDSGRYFVDLNKIIRVPPANASELSNQTSERSAQAKYPRSAPQKPVESGATLSTDEVRFLVEYAVLAPSGGNAQPWLFEWLQNRLIVREDKSRRTMLDVEGFGSQLAIGAAAFNIELAASLIGLKSEVRVPQSKDNTFSVELAFSRTSSEKCPLVDAIPLRCTNRRLQNNEKLTASEKHQLHFAARPGNLLFIEDTKQKHAIGEVIGELDRFRFLHRQLHKELYKELRWSTSEVEATRDGIDVHSLELPGVQRQLLQTLSNTEARSRLQEIDGAQRLASSTRGTIVDSSAFGVLTHNAAEGEQDYFHLGRLVQRVWLTATSLGLSLQPMTAGSFLLTRLRRGGNGFSDSERQHLAHILQRHPLANSADRAVEGFYFRIGKGDRIPTAIALRRPIVDVLTMHDN